MSCGLAVPSTGVNLVTEAHAHDWHSDLRLTRPGQGTVRCCGGYDCKAYPHRTDPSGLNYEILVNGTWVPVPYEVHLEMPSPDGQVHACCVDGQCDAVHAAGKEVKFRCAVVLGHGV
jgi:hypothetical protein